MAVTALFEILDEVTSSRKKEDKIACLQKHNNSALRNFFILVYDKKFKVLLPDTPPPYKPNKEYSVHNGYFKEAKMLKYFVEGAFDGNLTQLKREQLFIRYLEGMHEKDANLLITHVLTKTPIKGITVDMINTAFGNIIKDF